MRGFIFTALVSATLGASLISASIAVASEPSAVVDVVLVPAGDFKAKTQDVKGEVIQEGDTVRAENIIVNLKSLKTGISLRDKHAKDKYLQVDKYPEAILLHATGKGGKGKGRVKIRGVEKDVEGSYAIENGFLKADFPIKLSDYGITGVKYMGLGVDDKVNIHVVVPVKK